MSESYPLIFVLFNYLPSPPKLPAAKRSKYSITAAKPQTHPRTRT